jgi:tetratricopeptide (TPR) repeat protein
MKKSDSFEGNESASRLVLAAETLADQCDWNAAEPLFHQAIALDASAASQIAYGVCLSRQERYFEAISVFTLVLDGDDWAAIGIACHNLAAIYRDLGDLDLARRFQWRATRMQDDSGPSDLLGMANDAFASEFHQAAQSLVMTAIDILSDESSGTSDGDFMAALGLVHSVLASPEQGLMSVFAAYRQHQVAADLRAMGTDQLNMAILFGELKRYAAERACLQRAIRYFEQVPAPYSLDRAKRMLSRFDRMGIVRSFNAHRN